LACPITPSLAPPIQQLLTDLDGLRATRRTLARAVAALTAKEIWSDDELNRVLDDVKAALASDKSESGVAFYKDVFENKSPSDVRKYILGPQLVTMTAWPGKLSESARPEVKALGVESKQVTDASQALLNDIGKAETALEQFDLGPRVAFVASCNAAVASVFGKLSEMEHNPPKGSLPAGFVDRFLLRDGSGRASSDKELEAAVERARARLSRLEAQLQERKDKRAKELKARREAELAEKTARAAAAQKAAAEAAAELAALQAEIEKDTPDEP
jgi:hypothetical protein